LILSLACARPGNAVATVLNIDLCHREYSRTKGFATYRRAFVASTALLRPRFTPELAEIVAAWPELPEAIKAGIVAMVRAARP
jgi:hypothetical protein